ncbi:putative NEDD8-conjugating enzyme Ubc12-like [Taenia crassiceps]|uniref:NEDD8-conjugating enzyme Ubc12-like n=1 Tax=Taenia crassiceps TaxID=6207 RepID=A0ABR4Q5C8_9CEST
MSGPTTQRTFFKDLQQLYRTIETSTDGQATITGIDEMSVRVLLRPKFGTNAHAEFILVVRCTSSYPRSAPEVNFSSPIFHPNIDSMSGSICLSLLNEWQSCHSLLDVVKAMLYLIEHPNFSSANNSLATLEKPEQLASKTARLLAGLPVNGHRFPPNTAWCEWARANGCLPTREEEVDETNEVEAEVKEGAVAKEDESSKTDPANDLKINVITDDAALRDEKSDVDALDGMSIATSDTVPSFAKIRYSIEGVSDHDAAAIEFEEGADGSDKSELETPSEVFDNEACLVSLFDSSATDDEDSYSRKPARGGVRSSSPASSATYSDNYEPYPLMRDCTNCNYEFYTAREIVNVDLAPRWEWNGEMKNLVLLDPMALSPLSPLLNLMRHCVEPRPCLSGVLWMTPLDALSPSYRMPIPERRQQGETEDDDGGGGDNDAYPSAAHLRFLTLTAFLTNWAAWLSRVEAYTVLGTSRFSPALISAPVAAYVLQPLSLGCGQAPLLDLWPLWLLRRLFSLSLRLPQLRLLPSLHSHHHLSFLFPFSELDEV